MTARFIVIEGLDGSGKSTVVELLHQIISGSQIFKTLPKEYVPIRPYVYQSNNQYAKLHYYISGNFFVSAKVEEAIFLGKTVICDRYYYSTIADHSELFDDSKLYSNACEIFNKMMQPDFAFFLDVDEDVRVQRIRQRLNPSESDIASLSPDVKERKLLDYKKFDFIHIDTSQITPFKTAETIKDYLDKA
jgi:dTMP kinase